MKLCLQSLKCRYLTTDFYYYCYFDKNQFIAVQCTFPSHPRIEGCYKAKKIGVFSCSGKIKDFYWEITRFWGKSNNKDKKLDNLYSTYLFSPKSSVILKHCRFVYLFPLALVPHQLLRTKQFYKMASNHVHWHQLMTLTVQQQHRR